MAESDSGIGGGKPAEEPDRGPGDGPDREPGEDPRDAQALRWLRRLVMALTATLIVGTILVVGLLALRLTRPPIPDFPERLTLPAGETVTGISRSAEWTAIITRDATGQGRIHILRPGGGRIHQSVEIARE